ncbi:MAG: hypothetical protein KatS3mg014_1815 [Actinomycetota bacterium]|nr:MAG: hypothetical protein KatS3mg014_1815 [Actinomycetota bacterium]
MRVASHLYGFAKVHPEVEGVLQHVGRRTFDLLLIDVDGDWVRDVLESPEEAEEVARSLGVPLHRGWDDPRIARRMNARDAWGTPGGRRRGL